MANEELRANGFLPGGHCICCGKDASRRGHYKQGHDGKMVGVLLSDPASRDFMVSAIQAHQETLAAAA